MKPIDDVKNEIIQSSLRIARSWDSRNDPNWSSRSYSTAMFAMLSKAVTECDNDRDGIHFLDSLGAHECLHDVCRSFQKLREKVVTSRELPWTVLGGNYHLIVFSHIATLLEDRNAAAILLQIANEQEVVRLGTPFWSAYVQGLLHLANREIFEVPPLKLRSGLEQYWIRYLHLMRHLVCRENTTHCLRDIEAAFAARNRDTRIKDDQYEIEGSALHPVNWDFRKAAILKAIA